MNCIETQAMSLKLHVSMAPHHPSIPAPSGESAVSAAVAHKRCTSLQVVNSQTHRDVHSSRILTTYSGFCGLRNSQLQPDCLDRFLKRGAKSKARFCGSLLRSNAPALCSACSSSRVSTRLDFGRSLYFTCRCSPEKIQTVLHCTVQYSTTSHLAEPWQRGKHVIAMSVLYRVRFCTALSYDIVPSKA